MIGSTPLDPSRLGSTLSLDEFDRNDSLKFSHLASGLVTVTSASWDFYYFGDNGALPVMRVPPSRSISTTPFHGLSYLPLLSELLLEY